MKKGFLAVFLIVALSMALGLSACSKSGGASAEKSSSPSPSADNATQPEAEVDGSAYGYAGTDPVEAAVYKYMVKEVGEHYNAFMKAYSDEEARKELRTITVSDYVNLNGLAVTQYQDYGWEPVKLYK